MKIKEILIRYAVEIKLFINRIRFWILSQFKDCIYLEGFSSGRNFGDAINLVLIKELSGGKYPISRRYVFPSIYKKQLKYFFIGSIIGGVDDKSIIYGAGAISKTDKIRKHPLKVLSTRGALTRKLLISQGVKCPEIYGDPALLLPQYYYPSIPVVHKCAIVPHYEDISNHFVKKLIDEGGYFLNIRIKDSIYKEWKSKIDEFCSSDIIISSSLHGLIIGDAYRKKTLWVKFSDNILGDDFKFYDYYSSMGIDAIIPIDLRETSYSLEELTEMATLKPVDKIDLDLFLAQNPWKFGK